MLLFKRQKFKDRWKPGYLYPWSRQEAKLEFWGTYRPTQDIAEKMHWVQGSVDQDTMKGVLISWTRTVSDGRCIRKCGQSRTHVFIELWPRLAKIRNSVIMFLGVGAKILARVIEVSALMFFNLLWITVMVWHPFKIFFIISKNQLFHTDFVNHMTKLKFSFCSFSRIESKSDPVNSRSFG